MRLDPRATKLRDYGTPGGLPTPVSPGAGLEEFLSDYSAAQLNRVHLARPQNSNGSGCYWNNAGRRKPRRSKDFRLA